MPQAEADPVTGERKDMPKDMPKDLPKDLPKDMPKDLPKDLHKALPKQKPVIDHDLIRSLAEKPPGDLVGPAS